MTKKELKFEKINKNPFLVEFDEDIKEIDYSNIIIKSVNFIKN